MMVEQLREIVLACLVNAKEKRSHHMPSFICRVVLVSFERYSARRCADGFCMGHLLSDVHYPEAGKQKQVFSKSFPFSKEIIRKERCRLYEAAWIEVEDRNIELRRHGLCPHKPSYGGRPGCEDTASGGPSYFFWQSAPDWFWLRHIPTLEQKLRYIHYNPMQDKWKLCDRAIDYPFSSLRFYIEGQNTFSFLRHYNEFVENALWLAE